MARPMANSPPFARLNHFAGDLGIPRESATLRLGITRYFRVKREQITGRRIRVLLGQPQSAPLHRRVRKGSAPRGYGYNTPSRRQIGTKSSIIGFRLSARNAVASSSSS